jgi:hypothetical protein
VKREPINGASGMWQQKHDAFSAGKTDMFFFNNVTDPYNIREAI